MNKSIYLCVAQTNPILIFGINWETMVNCCYRTIKETFTDKITDSITFFNNTNFKVQYRITNQSFYF